MKKDTTNMISSEICKLSPKRLRWVQEEVSKNDLLHNTEVEKYINRIIHNVSKY